MSLSSGCLYVVATPIGHLDDISARALEVLGSVRLILAEDTRHSAKLLSRYGITTKVQAFHEHNERQASCQIVERILSGERIALISDAGTPLISDPGFHLVSLAHQRGARVIPIPGPSSLLAALSVSGLPTDRFMFEGFLPSKPAQRRRRLEELAEVPCTLVVLESSHRLLAALKDMVELLGSNRRASLAKELTKVYESVRTDRLDTLVEWVEQTPERQKGEFVIVLAGADEVSGRQAAREHAALLKALLDELPLKTAVKVAARVSGAGRNSLYELALELNRTRPNDI